MRTRLLLAALMAWCSWPMAASAKTVEPHPIQAPALSVSGAVLELTLEEAVALALRDNRQLRSVRLWRLVDRFDLFLARRAYWPTGNASLSAVRRKMDGLPDSREASLSSVVSWTSPIGTAASVGWSRQEDLDGKTGGSDVLSVSIRQPLLRGAGLDVNMAPLRQANMAAELSRMREEEATSDLIDQVTYAYRSLIQAQERVALARIGLERSRQLLLSNTAMIEAGRMAAADLVQTQSDVANQEVALLETERALNVSRMGLLGLLALDPDTPLHVVNDIQVEPVEIDAEAAVAYALANRRDVRAQKLNMSQLALNEKLARNSRLWDVSLTAGYDRYSGGALRSDLDGHSLGVQLTIPLGDFSGRRAEMAARTAVHSAELSYDTQLEFIEAQVREAVADVRSRWLQLDAAQRARGLAERSLDIQQERLEAGRATNFEVLSLQSGLRNADAQALAARIAYLNALTALDNQLGRTLETWQISLEY